MKPRRAVRWIITALVVAGAGWMVVSLFNFNERLKAEYGTIRVVQAVEEYVAGHRGRWPSSWTELDETHVARECGGLVRNYTNVDFSLTTEDILADPDLIDIAVTPVTGKYEIYPHAHRDLNRVLQAMRDARERHTKSAVD